MAGLRQVNLLCCCDDSQSTQHSPSCCQNRGQAHSRRRSYHLLRTILYGTPFALVDLLLCCACYEQYSFSKAQPRCFYCLCLASLKTLALANQSFVPQLQVFEHQDLPGSKPKQFWHLPLLMQEPRFAFWCRNCQIWPNRHSCDVHCIGIEL